MGLVSLTGILKRLKVGELTAGRPSATYEMQKRVCRLDSITHRL
jgi:hypothetical protein